MFLRSIRIKLLILACAAVFSAASNSLCAQNSNRAVLAGSSSGLHESPARSEPADQGMVQSGSAADWAAGPPVASDGQARPDAGFHAAQPAGASNPPLPSYPSGVVPTPLPTPAAAQTQAYQPTAVPAYPPVNQLPIENVQPTPLQSVPQPQRTASMEDSRLRPAEPYSQVVTASATSPIPQPPVDLEPPQESAPKRTPFRPGRDRDQENLQSASGDGLQMILSVGSSLLIVVGLFLGVVWVYRKSLTTTVGQSVPNQVVEVIGRTPIAARQQLVLVRFGNKLVLVSLVQGEARTISEITDPIEVDRLAGLCESGKSNSISNSFRNILAQGGAA